MIVFTKELLQDSSILINTIEKEKMMIELSIKSQENFKKLLSDSMRKLTNSQETINPLYSDFITSLVENQKNNLAFSQKNIALLEDLLLKLEYIYNLYTQNMEISYELIEKFNIAFLNSNNVVLENTLQIEKTLNLIFLFSEFTFNNENKNEKISNDTTNSIIHASLPTKGDIPTDNHPTPIDYCENKNIQLSTKENFCSKLDIENIKSIEYSNPKDEKNESTTIIPSRNIDSLLKKHDFEKENILDNNSRIDGLNLVENTLIISEEKRKVFLPYTLSDLQKTFDANQNKYSSLEDVIEKDYTLPLNFYKNASKARFKETFKLIHEKEKKSLKESLDLGMELFSNSNLHPAIISACRNKDELDNYLYHLAKNETEKFECFKIIFDINPAIKTKLNL